MVDLCSENLTTSLLLQMMRVNQNQQSLLVNTLLQQQQRVFSTYLQQNTLLPSSVLDNVHNRNTLDLQLNAQSLLNTTSQPPFISNISNAQQTLSKTMQSTSFSTLACQKTALEESMERKRLIRAKLLSGRPRANTSPAATSLIHKIRPKTQSFNSPSTQKQCAIFRHHPANLPTRNPDTCALEEFAAVYLLNSLDNQKPSKPAVRKNLKIDVNQILDDVLETSQL